jgi:hypothetical protein
MNTTLLYLLPLLLRLAPCDDGAKNKILCHYVRPGMARQQAERILIGLGGPVGGIVTERGYAIVYPGVVVWYRPWDRAGRSLPSALHPVADLGWR